MSDRRLRELERIWRESGAASDEARLISERLRLGLLRPGRVALAQTLDHEGARLLDRLSDPPDSEIYQRRAMLLGFALAVRYQRSTENLLSLMRSWRAAPEAGPGAYPVIWQQCVGTSTNSSTVWHDLFMCAGTEGAQEAASHYGAIHVQTRAIVSWNGGSRALAEFKQATDALDVSVFLPWLVGHPLPRLRAGPVRRAMGRR